jgi:hypothetical protein
MLTFLSRSIRRLVTAAPSSVAPPLLPAPRLRLVSGAASRDIPIAAARPSASAFVAGQGARLYSLDVFRRQPLDPRTPRAA